MNNGKNINEITKYQNVNWYKKDNNIMVFLLQSYNTPGIIMSVDLVKGYHIITFSLTQTRFRNRRIFFNYAKSGDEKNLHNLF